MSTFGSAESNPPSDRPGASSRVWASWLLPPDFYPERRVDAQTWAEAIFEPFALIGSVVCFVLGMISFGLAVAPSWDARFLPALSLVVGLESFFYSRRLVRSVLLWREWLTLLVPPVLLARFLPYLDDPQASLAADVVSWWHDPERFFSVAFVADVIILLIVWSIVFAGTRCLNELRVQEGEILESVDRRFAQLYEDNWRSYDHLSALRTLGQMYIWGGGILVVLSAISSIGIQQLFTVAAISQLIGFQRPSLQLVLANVVLYFVLGLLLLGEAHFVRQRTLWRLDHLSVPTEVPRRWLSSVVGLVAVAGLIAALLPTSYAMTLGDLISGVLAIVMGLLVYAAAAIFYLLYLLSTLFPVAAGGSERSAPMMPPHLPTTPPPTTGPSPLDTLKSLIFWLVAVGIIVYSLSVLWRRRGRWLDYRLPGRAISILVALGRWLLGLIRQFGRQVGQVMVSVVPGLLRQASQRTRRPARLVSLGRLGPRELIEYYYLSICERAAQLGHPRPPGVTPVEYRTRLQQALPEVEPEIGALTEAFVAARYGPHPPSSNAIQSARLRWQTLKLKLRRLRIERLDRGQITRGDE